MNNPGINKIYYMKTSDVNLPVSFTPGEVVDITPYLSGTLTELEFEPESFSKKEVPVETDAGLYIETKAAFTVSGITPEIHTVLSSLSREPHIFVFGDNEGQHFLVGTNSMKPKFVYNMAHINSPGSAKNYKINITLKSTHGLIFCTIV